MPRILLAGLFHETHTFVDDTTGLRSFATAYGDDLLTRKGDGSPIGGFLETAARHGWEVIPTVDMRASPSGMVEDEVVERWWMEFSQRAAKPLRDGVDAIYLVLHGAMVSRCCEDVEGVLLERIRAMAGAGTVPIFGVYDLHAHFTARMARHANCLVGYRENPHTDARAMAVHAAELLHRTLTTGKVPRQHWKHARIMWPPTGTGTADTPMKDLEALARDLEARHPDLLAVNVTAGFSFADTPDTGVSFTVATTGDDTSANAALDELCALAWELRHKGNAVDAAIGDVLQKVARHARAEGTALGPIVLVEPSDNIGGGAPGDGTGLLRAFVKHQLTNAAVCINDPDAVRALQRAAVGERRTLPIGGKGSRLDEGPLPLEVTLVSRSDGRFQLEDKQSHLASMSGDSYDMGPCAVVRHHGLTILLTSRKTPPFDLGQWRSQGIEPQNLSVIGVKAAVAHRRAYDKIASLMLWADTPGPCRSDLTKLPFRKVRRPIFPLDE
jgi:microcystin degradation protein MlrC